MPQAPKANSLQARVKRQAEGRAASPSSAGRGGKRCRGGKSPSAPPAAPPPSPAEPEPRAGHRIAMLGVASEAIAASLLEGQPLVPDRTMCELRDELLAESADASEAAATRCRDLRADLAAALRKALSSRPKAALLVNSTSAAGSGLAGRTLSASCSTPKVRVEVRQTAGRCIVDEAFAVGRAPEADVQTSGDCTVSRLQFVVISLPGGIVVVDAWSSGGTRVVRRGESSRSLPASTPTCRSSFVLPHGERIIILVGKRTTVSLGPSAAEAALCPPPPALADFDAVQPQALGAKTAEGARVVEACSAGDIATPRTSGIEAEPSVQPTADEASGGGEPVSRQAKLARCLAVVRACVRIRRACRERERSRWRCFAARRARLISAEHCLELQAMLQPFGANALEEVTDILDGLGVPLALDDPAFVRAPGNEGETWSCLNCGMLQRSRGWRCPLNRHRYCRECLVTWSEPRALPLCPQEGCGYRFGEHDIEDLRLTPMRLEAFRSALRMEPGRPLIPQESANLNSGVFNCPGSGCGAAIVLGSSEARRRWVCPCGTAPTCIGCNASPYHYHAPCDQVQALRARWVAWNRGGREAYKALQDRVSRKVAAFQIATKELMGRLLELEREERLKAEKCRVCPKCQNVVEKTDCLNTVVCGGQRIPDGERPTGCGHRFNWLTAKLPKAKIRATSAHVAKPLTAPIGGRGVRHLYTQCSICGSGGKCITGPRFRCIHCQSFNACMKCEDTLAAQHEDSHVFEIMFEDDIDWVRLGVMLPKGTKVRLRHGFKEAAPEPVVLGGDVAAGAAVPAGKRKWEHRGAGLEGVVKGNKRGKYLVEFPGFAEPTAVGVEELQPLLTQRQAERLLPGLVIPGQDEVMADEGAVE